ncbi:uncharacterized protein GlcG (DUF336 family) [Palleronia aestuarii]|uniref:Uncharacterized protein GlcG (DUF336 family) n=1 Tax=Palleronia aestuarii TaxID=568105 RepID=A0A2W7ND19_9RHOB|nr:heme-binding protein [Palleronia aestuarii]PZX18281.1 uncharacterized protein GlcG (DUF336 family) [Palleronia aestuarii]
MSYTRETAALTHAGVLKMLHAASEKATEIGQPQCIVIVDASGELQGELRMDGAKFLSRKSAHAKARTAAATRKPTADVPDAMKQGLGMATQGEVTGLPGGLPIFVGGQHLGGIGIGSGTGDQDVACATAALEAIGADM